MKKIFFILDGNNGATYIFNIKSLAAITQSLKFYKARSWKQSILKISLIVFLFFLGLLSRFIRLSILKNKDEIIIYLKKISYTKINFELDNNCSILISPTKDKVIIHHHDDYFYKYAFGNSLKKVKNEISVYKLLDKPLIYFQISKIYDVYEESYFCSFKLKNNITKKNLDLVLALVEFFNSKSEKKYTLLEYIILLEKRCSVLYVTNSTIRQQFFENIKNNYANSIIPLGLVHRDFKPWNISDKGGLLIYDFEETVTDGLPLEDLFNYFIDPVLRYKTSKDIADIIFDVNKVNLYQDYLKNLNLDIDFHILLYFYLLERAIFWAHENNPEMTANYIKLFDYLNFKMKKL